MVNEVLILRKLSELEQYYFQIQEFAAIKADEYEND